MAEFRKTIEQHPVATTITVMCIIFGFILSAIIATKDATIELKDEKIKNKDEAIAAYEKKSERDSLTKVELSNKVKSLELALGKSAQKKTLSDTTLCPGKGILIFDGNAIVTYHNYAEPAHSAQISIRSEGKLKINEFFYFSGPSSEFFTVNKQEYIFNFLGFDQEKGKGCAKISINRK
jgi:hypothetical protein